MLADVSSSPKEKGSVVEEKEGKLGAKVGSTEGGRVAWGGWYRVNDGVGAENKDGERVGACAGGG